MPEVHIVGEIVGASDFESLNVFAKWRIVSQSDKWRVLDGDAAGRTYIAEPEESNDLLLWNHPVNVQFVTSGLSGWPKLFVEVAYEDELNRTDLAGYGSCFIPTSPGEHEIVIPTFRPKGSVVESLMGKFLGGQPMYDNPDVILTSASRFGHRTVSTGYVHVKLNVVLGGFGRTVRMSTTPLEDKQSVATGQGGD